MLASSPILWKQFLYCGSLFSDGSSLCQDDIKVANTEAYSSWLTEAGMMRLYQVYSTLLSALGPAATYTGSHRDYAWQVPAFDRMWFCGHQFLVTVTKKYLKEMIARQRVIFCLLDSEGSVHSWLVPLFWGLWWGRHHAGRYMVEQSCSLSIAKKQRETKGKRQDNSGPRTELSLGKDGQGDSNSH